MSVGGIIPSCYLVKICDREKHFRYELDAFISHMGPSNHSGHYVCHIRDKKDPSKWVIFNDNKVNKKRIVNLNLTSSLFRWPKV